MVSENMAKPKERRHSAAQWRELVADWEQSGLSRDRWCAERGVNSESLRRWGKRFERSVGDTGVVELPRATESPMSRTSLRVRIAPNGEIELSGAINEEVLRCLIHAVQTSGNVH